MGIHRSQRCNISSRTTHLSGKNNFSKQKGQDLFALTSEKDLRAVIIGSFRKHLPQIQTIRHQLERLQINVLSPIDSVPINAGDEFIIFEDDTTQDPKSLQEAVFEKIKTSSFVIVANVDGYLGNATLIEIGYALACGIDLFALESVSNLHVKPFCRLVHELSSMITCRFSLKKKEHSLNQKVNLASNPM